MGVICQATSDKTRNVMGYTQIRAFLATFVLPIQTA